MNTYKKALYAYYIKLALATIGFSILHALSFISANTNNNNKIQEYYNKFLMSMAKPVENNMNANIREQVHVA